MTQAPPGRATGDVDPEGEGEHRPPGAGHGGRRHSRRPARWAPPGANLALGAGIFLLYLVPAVVAYWHIWTTHPSTTALAGGAGDPAQYEWFLAWIPWAIAHGHNPFVTQWVNYPYGIDVMANPSVVALALTGAPITAIWGPVATLNVAFTLAFPLSASAGYVLARRFTTWRPAAFAAGLLYGFSPYVVAQGSFHLNLTFVPLPPLILLVLYDLLVGRRSPWRCGAALGVLVVVQYFISSEILATTALFAAIAVVALAIRFPRQVPGRLPALVEAAVVAAVITLVVLAYPLDVLFAGRGHISGAIPGYKLFYSALFAPVLPTSIMVFGTHHMKVLGDMIGGNEVENGTYLGAPLVLLALVAVVTVRSRAVRIAAALAVVAFILSLGVSLRTGLIRFARFDGRLPLPGALLAKMPLLDQAFPVRYALYVALFVSVVLAVTIDAVHARLAGRGRGVAAGVAAGLAVIVLLPLVPAWPYPMQGAIGVPSYFTGSGVDRVPAGSVALVYPIATDLESVAQLWQAEANFRFQMPGGYFVVPRPGGGSQYNTVTTVSQTLSEVLSGPAPARTATLRRRLRAQLGSWHVRSVAALTVGHDPVGFFTWLVGRPPDTDRGGVAAWYRVDWRS
jgi:hypothetical protein